MNQGKPGLVFPALVGGAFLGVTSALPLVELVNCACCALVIGGGLIASFLYIRDYPPGQGPILYGDGVLLGLLTGVFGAFIWTAVDIPLEFFKLQLGTGMMEMAELEELLDDPNIPPAAREIARAVMSAGGGGLTLGIALFSFFVNLFISVIFAVIGAVIGVAVFQKKPSGPPPNYAQMTTPPQQTPPQQTPPPADPMS